MAQPLPINLDDLTTRLEVISAEIQELPRPSFRIGSDCRSRDTTESLDEERDLMDEMKYYNTLVSEGGRPSHPVSLGPDVIEDPGKYREILSYWQVVNHDAEGRVWRVFASQKARWRAFREWQQKNRENGRFPTYFEGVKQGLAEHEFTRTFQLDQDPERQDKLTTWIEYLDYEYRWYDKDMRFVKLHQPEYDAAWKELVDSQVLRPSETQEFICNITSSFQRASEEERAEKAVELAKITVTFVQHSITNPRPLSEKEAQRRLAAAKSGLDAATKTLESVKRRNDLVSEFLMKTKVSSFRKDGTWEQTYVGAKDGAEHRSILLRWILLQVPLIALELNQASVAENDPDSANGTSCHGADKLSEGQSSEEQARKRKRHENTVEDRLPSKRSRYKGQGSSLSAQNTAQTANAIPTRRPQESRAAASMSKSRRKVASGKPERTSGERRGKGSNLSTLNSSLPRNNNIPRVPPGPGIAKRRSVRIAEREERSRIAVVAPSDTVRSPRQRTARLAQAPITPPSTESQKRKPRPRATKTSMRGRPSRGDGHHTPGPQGISKKRGQACSWSSSG